MIQIDSSAGLLYDPRLTDPVRRLYLAEATMEIALNKTGAITLTVPEGNPVYGRLQELSSEVWVLQDGVEIFRGRVREIHEDLEGLQEVVVEGLKAFLRDEQLRPYTKSTYGSTVAGWLQMAVNTYNAQRQAAGVTFVPFSVGTVDEQALEIEAKDYGDILSAIDKGLFKAVGGYVFVDRVNGENVITWTKESGPIDEQPIAYGVNLTGYKRGDSAADTFTAVIPLGKNDGDNGKLTIKSVNDGSDMLVDAAAAAERGLIVKKIDHNDIDDATALKNAGLADLDEAGRIAASIEASAVDLADAGVNVERLRLGHQNYVQITHTGTPVLLPISKISVNLIDPGSGRYTFSQQFQTLTQQQSSASAAAHAAQQTANAAATPQSVAQQIAASEQKYADYVTETGSSSGWRWRKWKNGKDLEAWGVFTVTMGTASAYTSELEVAEGSVSLPISTADTGSILEAAVCDSSDGAVASVRQTAANTLAVRVIAPTVAVSYQIAIALRGRYS